MTTIRENISQKDHSRRTWQKQAIFLFLATLFIRFPFFFRDYIDRDESTFILMGQSIADGHLPYVHLWDLKPPLLFYIFGAVESIFPDSFIAIRFTGVLVVFFSALLMMAIARRWGSRNGFLAALLYVILCSELGNLQGLMSEHLAVMFLLAGLYFFLPWQKPWQLVFAGIGFGCALLCKLSYAYGLVVLSSGFSWIHWKELGLFRIAVRNIFLAGGIMLPFLLISIPYIESGHWSLLFDSVVRAPLEYSKAEEIPFLKKLQSTWIIIVIGLLIAWLASRKIHSGNRKAVVANIALLLPTIYTFYSSGILNGHYLILVYPFLLLLLAGVIISNNLRIKWVVIVIFVLLISVESLVEYSRVIKNLNSNGTAFNGPSFQIVNELKKQGLDSQSTLFLDYHIGYWLLDQYPLTKSSTHPSNLRRDFLFPYLGGAENSLAEIKNLMEKTRPAVVVSKFPRMGFFPENSEENNYFTRQISEGYELVFRQEKPAIFIWKRKFKLDRPRFFQD